jgi:serine protease AprX
MRLTKLMIAGTVLATVVLVVPTLGLARQSGPRMVAPIRLKAATFTPSEGEEPDIPPRLKRSEYAQGQRGYYIVQFGGPVEEAWKEGVTALGAELLDYVPDFAFKVRMNPGQARQVARLSNVTWVGFYHPAYKLSPELLLDEEAAQARSTDTSSRLYTVRIERGSDVKAAAEAVADTGATISFQEGEHLVVLADAAQVDAIAQVLDVAWVQAFKIWEKHNEYGAGVIMGANIANASGYDGSTQIVAVADTGIGGGTASTAHADIPSGRITAIYNWPASSATGCYYAYPDGSQDVDSGHGTHTSLSVLSDGGTGGEGRGTAPGASLVFQSVEDYADMYGSCSVYADGYYLLGLPSDLTDLFQQAYDAGARIHSNSWGSSDYGDYTQDSVYVDIFMWNNPDMLIIFSAGNDGTDSNGNGVVDSDSIGSPATAKNTLTVGASENDRDGNWDCDSSLGHTTCSGQGGQNVIPTYHDSWPSDFPANPLAGDPSAGNAEQMAAFSSRGPTDDSRIKPDVVAPGTWVLSGYSDMYQEGYDASSNPRNGLYQYDGWGFPLSEDYKYMGGTSMSTPLVAGGAAVVRDFYNKAYSHNASAALVKATIVNSAVDLLDENNDGSNDNDYPIPNAHEGWGLVNLANATDGSHEYVDVTGGLNSGGSATYQYDIDASGAAFKVTLVWSDYPSTASASSNLVNDLDLVVTSPGSTVYRGNVFGGGWSQTGGSADHTNNVENVYVASAESGAWTVEVSGYNVPNGPQPFALVVDGSFGTPTPTDTPTSTPTEGPTDTPMPTPTEGPTDTLTPTPTEGPADTPTPTPTPSNDWVELTYDDFESGWGNYTDGGGDCTRYTGGTYAHQGSAAADIQDNSGAASSFYHTNGIDVNAADYTQIKVEFWFRAVSMESGEDFWVQYYDGSTWHTVASYARGTDFANNVFYNETVYIDESSYTFPTNMRIRFMCDASGNMDDVYIDEVRVSAIGGSPTPTDTPMPTPTEGPTNTPIPTPANTPTPTAVFSDDFETDQGWTTDPDGSDTATTGMWERANPESTSYSGVTYQLGTTASGSYDLVTEGAAGSSVGSYDIDGGVTSIRSPDISLPSGSGITLSFQYYLAHYNNGSSDDFLRVSVVGSTTEVVFEETASGVIDAAVWESFSTSMDAFSGQTIYLLIEAADAGGGSLIEAAIDDVLIE